MINFNFIKTLKTGIFNSAIKFNYSEKHDDNHQDSMSKLDMLNATDVDLLNEFRLRWKNKNNSSKLDLESWFSSSSEEEDEDKTIRNGFIFDNLEGQKYMPLYRRQFGGILIYDIDGEIPHQPVPVQSLQDLGMQFPMK